MATDTCMIGSQCLSGNYSRCWSLLWTSKTNNLNCKEHLCDDHRRMLNHPNQYSTLQHEHSHVHFTLNLSKTSQKTISKSRKCPGVILGVAKKISKITIFDAKKIESRVFFFYPYREVEAMKSRQSIIQDLL